MKENIWIYLSCLAFCVAIGHRVWEYECMVSDFRSSEIISSAYDEKLQRHYSNKISRLIYMDKVSRSMDSAFRDSVAVLQYLVENSKLEELIIKNDNLNGQGLLQEYLPLNIQIYIYANSIIDNYLLALEDGNSIDLVKSISSVVDEGHLGSNISEVKLDLYSAVDNSYNVLYRIDGERSSNINGYTVSPKIPDNIKATLVNKITSETRTYEFDNIEID